MRVHRCRQNNNSPDALFVVCLLVCVLYAAAQELNAQTPPQPAERHLYKIDLKIDFDRLTYTGSERVRWINRSDKPTSIIYFHLYPNLRAGDQQFPANGSAADADEPRLDILEVRAGTDDALLFSSTDDQGTTLRINLREQVPSEGSAEVVIKFKGSVPEIDRDETSLTTHVVKQVPLSRRDAARGRVSGAGCPRRRRLATQTRAISWRLHLQRVSRLRSDGGDESGC